MARTFPLLLLGTLSLLQGFSAQTFDVPKAVFSVLPDAFSLGSQFTATCTVSGFDPSKYFQYSVVFYVKPAETRLAVLKKTPRIDLDLAKWSVYPSTPNINPKFEVSALAPAALDLTILKTGHEAYPPVFKVKMTPGSDDSRGKYFCKVKVWSSSAAVPVESTSSNEWNTGGKNGALGAAALPSAIFLIALAFISSRFV